MVMSGPELGSLLLPGKGNVRSRVYEYCSQGGRGYGNVRSRVYKSINPREGSCPVLSYNTKSISNGNVRSRVSKFITPREG